MKKKLLYLAIAMMGLFVACSEEEDLELPELVGMQLEYNVRQGTTFELNPKVVNWNKVAYEWILDNKTFSREAKLKFQPEERGSFKFKLRVSGEKGVGIFPFTVHVYGKYKYGAFI